MNDLISVIVPVYNVEKYLGQCLDSLVQQSYKALEILVIDDGSTDGSAEICDQYAAADERIQVFHTSNRGLSAARNLGLEHATGQYYAFLDSDDYIEPDLYERLYTALLSSGSDFSACGYFEEDNNRVLKTKIFPCKTAYSPGECLEQYVSSKQGNVGPMVWNKLYQAELFDALRFPEHHNYEDIWAFPRILDRCKKIQLVPEALYHHRMNRESISHNWTYRNFMDSYKSRKALAEYIRKKYPEYDEMIVQYLLKVDVGHWCKLLLTKTSSKNRKALQESIRNEVIALRPQSPEKERKIVQRLAENMIIHSPGAAGVMYLAYNQWRRCKGY